MISPCSRPHIPPLIHFFFPPSHPSPSIFVPWSQQRIPALITALYLYFSLFYSLLATTYPPSSLVVISCIFPFIFLCSLLSTINSSSSLFSPCSQQRIPAPLLPLLLPLSLFHFSFLLSLDHLFLLLVSLFCFPPSHSSSSSPSLSP